jgi:K+-transporting ATPase ATPase C chain
VNSRTVQRCCSSCIDLQAARVAHIRGLDVNKVKRLVTDHIQGRFLWIFGDPHVNVLNLNLALDTSQAQS